MSKWFAIAFIAIGMAIYRGSYNAGFLDSILVAAICGGIGGALGGLYDHFFGKHDFRIMDFIDNILWFIIFCIPGAITGVILAAPFNVNLIYPFQTVILLLTMVVVSLFLTMRKMKNKAKQRELELSNEKEI